MLQSRTTEIYLKLLSDNKRSKLVFNALAICNVMLDGYNKIEKERPSKENIACKRKVSKEEKYKTIKRIKNLYTIFTKNLKKK